MDIFKVITITICTVLIVSCGIGNKTPSTENTGEQIKPIESQAEIDRLAAFSVITSPADGSELNQSRIIVRAETPPTNLKIEKAILMINGVEVFEDSVEPWQFEWPTYFWADGSYALKLKFVTSGGQLISNVQRVTVQVDEKISAILGGLSFLDNQVIEEPNNIELLLPELTEADQYTLKVVGPTEELFFDSQSPNFMVDLSKYGDYRLQYRASKKINGEFLHGPYSEATEFSVIPLRLPEVATKVIKGDSLYQFHLDWLGFDTDSEYTIDLISKVDDSVAQTKSTRGNNVSFHDIPAGFYQWQLTRNRDLFSNTSEKIDIEIGAQKTSLGGGGIFDIDVAQECSEIKHEYLLSLGAPIFYNGEWDIYRNCLVGRAADEALILSEHKAKDFILDTSIRVIDANSASIIFRASDDGQKAYGVVLDVENQELRLERNGTDSEILYRVKKELLLNTDYFLKLVVVDGEIKILLDGILTISINDTNIQFNRYGNFGAKLSKGNGVFVQTSLLAFMERGKWLLEDSDLLASHPSWSGFALSNMFARNFVYEADLFVNKFKEDGVSISRSLGLIFRAQYESSGELNQGYQISLDVGGQLLVLKTPSGFRRVAGKTLNHDQTYRLKVVAHEENIRVFLNDTLVFDITNASYLEGIIGVEVFAGSGRFSNIKIDGNPVSWLSDSEKRH